MTTNDPLSAYSDLVRFRHVTCAYDGPPVIEDVNLRIERGAFLGLVGPSGSGKTSVLRALLGKLAPQTGHIERVTGTTVAYVPQLETVDWNFPVTVAEVVAMSMGRAPVTRAARHAERTRVEGWLDQLGIAGLADRQIRRLSGGQQQRVFLARALARDPDLLVLDEPTSGVDVRTRHEILHLLGDLHATGMTILLTTHDLNGLAAHLPRVVCFNRNVIADGSPLEVLTPAVLEATYGAPMEVLLHGGMPLVLEARPSRPDDEVVTP